MRRPSGALDHDAEVAIARAFWRRQLVLTCIALGAGIVALVLAAMAVQAGEIPLDPAVVPGRDGTVDVVVPGEEMRGWLMAAAGVGVIALAVVLVAVVLHTIRVATFAFRREVH